MQIDERFSHWFSITVLTELFWKKIRYRCSPGLDRIGITSFINNLDSNIETISRKVLNGTYTFTKYNELLISKGRYKEPRCVSRPTIRDKLALCALHGYLQELYSSLTDTRLMHTKINGVIENLTNYSHCIKVDLVGFYPSISHEILFEQLSEKTSSLALELVKKAITTPTVSREFNSNISEIKLSKSGVPEGLSISNLLANIYLCTVDTHFANNEIAFYCRYVDDILILANKENIEKIKSDATKQLTALSLKIHEFGESDKSCIVSCDKGFSYLGYYYSNEKISIKSATIDRFEHSLERMFSEYKKQECNLQKDKLHNPDMFAWKINLKIAGCIYNARKYGWLFFYSQITDLSLLRHLDWLVGRLYKRYQVPESTIGIKSFFKTYHEIKYNLSSSTYFYNVDKMAQDDLEHVIRDIFHYLVPSKKIDIEQTFFNVFNKSLKELERDVQFFS